MIAFRAGFAITLLTAVAADAHFALRSPASWREQNAYGNPQKTGPCGDDGAAATTGIVTPYAPGETITITLDETIYHPGHYRVALAVADRSELPPEPLVTTGSTDCGSAPIVDPPVFPVLADGLLVHDAPFSGTQTIQVTLPSDVTCTHCTLQVLEFMSEHGAPCFYYHCADISIGAPPVGCTTDVGCADADACTTDVCGPDDTCVHDPLSIDEVTPGFIGPMAPTECSTEPLPATFGKFARKAEALVLRAAAKPAKAPRLLARAASKLERAAAKVAAMSADRLPGACRAALVAAIDAAGERVECLRAASQGQ